MPSDLFILKPFNLMFFLMLAVTALLGALLILFFRKKDEKIRRRVIVVLYTITLVLFAVYKIALSFDKPYSDIRVEAGLGAFNFWDELPLNLCNINIILIIIGVFTNSRPILSFNFFFGTLGALFPILMPLAGFSGYSILFPRMLGYYVTHYLILLQMPLLAGLDIFRPKFRDILPSTGLLAIIVALMTGVNYLFRAIGVSQTSNYFYTMHSAGNPILDIFYKLIPCPGVYLLPCAVIVLPYMLIVTTIFFLCSKKQKGKN